MTNKSLAAAIRAHLISIGQPRDKVNAVPDRRLIEIQAHCPDCGLRLICPQHFKELIHRVKSFEEFKAEVDQFHDAHFDDDEESDFDPLVGTALHPNDPRLETPNLN